MIHATRGIVLRTIKYGETSIISTIFTETFGIQSYLINGVRTNAKNSKAHYFQPASLLDLQVYHNELKNLQRIKEVKWSFLYKTLWSSILGNAVALYMVELLANSLKQPQEHIDLFQFSEDAFIQLDESEENIIANFPIYFALQLAPFLGFQLIDNYSEERNCFNVVEGDFSPEFTKGEVVQLSKENSLIISEMLKVRHPAHLNEVKMNRNKRKSILKDLETYYLWHVPGFSSLKTLMVLHEVF